ncbi:membrane-bound lytic murein transglycosylase B [Paucibacter oligotrophus]|uniref:Membrane-bound lytic murein transglycosylase B n=1 Tax=Roseateles oligotrophus TaxID=1769250 RepID=A0A840L4H5_9BURK|nr:lytic murein transglycosylase B [Roseateles oligotrophus]MBB4841733.1 membrane-bound lytic murein transglycosylase B [Roseateles oligotrophus]
MTLALLPPPCRLLFQTRLLSLTLALGAFSLHSHAGEAHKPVKAAPASQHKKNTRAANKPGKPLGERPEILRFAAELAKEQGWDEASQKRVESQLAQALSLPLVQRLIMPAAAGTAKDWAAYRARFVEPRRLQAGLAFWEKNAASLAKAEAQFGVPAELIAGLIGVETFYGQITGGFRVIDALATLAFDFPSGRSDRSPFFRSELAEFFKLCRREGLDPLKIKGSFAGALGWPQFMPGSWNRYAIDFDGDGHVDLINNQADAIGSVANYLAQHGWKPGQPTHYSLAMPVETSARASLLAPDIKPSFTLAQLQALGAQPSEAALEHTGLLAVVELQNGEAAPTYWLGTENFYALTRYNWSSYYAFAVIDLGRTLANLRKDQSGR